MARLSLFVQTARYCAGDVAGERGEHVCGTLEAQLGSTLHGSDSTQEVPHEHRCPFSACQHD
jgi:hypothetical protein